MAAQKPSVLRGSRNSEEGSNEEKEEEVVAEKDEQVGAEEKLEEINLGSDS